MEASSLTGPDAIDNKQETMKTYILKKMNGP